MPAKNCGNIIAVNFQCQCSFSDIPEILHTLFCYFLGNFVQCPLKHAIKLSQEILCGSEQVIMASKDSSELCAKDSPWMLIEEATDVILSAVWVRAYYMFLVLDIPNLQALEGCHTQSP